MKCRVILIILLLLYSPFSIADVERCENSALFFEEHIPETSQLVFEDDDTSLPRPSDFELINYYLMSNECGERWALVTVKNLSSGARSLDGEQLVALTADGTKRKGKFSKRINGNSIESFSINFGSIKVPIIALLINTK